MATLPQNDSPQDQLARKDQLKKSQEMYVYNHKYLEGIPMLQDVPDVEDFSTGYSIENGLILSRVALSLLEKRLEIWDRFNSLSDFGDFAGDLDSCCQR